MDKVIVRLWGGIGNQLFQYSFGEYLRNTKSVRVEYDCNSFGNSDKLRKLEIESAVGSIPITTENAISKYTGVINRVIRCIYNISNKFVLEENFSEEKFDTKKRRSIFTRILAKTIICILGLEFRSIESFKDAPFYRASRLLSEDYY